ncbi:unnamed protein product [Somion occarium]|uniref:Uncharacterized protein n=1 Tax=Somion occarium TaxID=3059160 RepID=A0ABP1DAZ1_9APHY
MHHHLAPCFAITLSTLEEPISKQASALLFLKRPSARCETRLVDQSFRHFASECVYVCIPTLQYDPRNAIRANYKSMDHSHYRSSSESNFESGEKGEAGIQHRNQQDKNMTCQKNRNRIHNCGGRVESAN